MLYSRQLLAIAANVVIAALVLFALRRLLWVAASWRSGRKVMEGEYLPVVQVTSAFRNEEDSLPALLQHLDALDYPSDRFSICLVDDGSTDKGPACAASWARGREQVRLLTLSASRGKAAALNQALAAAGPGVEIIVVYDADQRPEPLCLRRLVAPFSDPRVDAVGGYCRPVPAAPTAISAYACLEAWTHQLVNLAAKDALGLNPPTIGANCGYRRVALNAVGGFPIGSFSEDIEVSLAMSARGGMTRFIAEAVTETEPPRTFGHFCNQRLRWSRGMMAARRHVRGLETALVTAGYMDRVLLLPAVVGMALGALSPWWLVAFAAPAFAALVSALAKARPEPRLAAVVLTTLPWMFIADLAVSALAAVSVVSGRPLIWKPRPASGSLRG